MYLYYRVHFADLVVVFWNAHDFTIFFCFSACSNNIQVTGGIHIIQNTMYYRVP